MSDQKKNNLKKVTLKISLQISFVKIRAINDLVPKNKSKPEIDRKRIFFQVNDEKAR